MYTVKCNYYVKAQTRARKYAARLMAEFSNEVLSEAMKEFEEFRGSVDLKRYTVPQIYDVVNSDESQKKEFSMRVDISGRMFYDRNAIKYIGRPLDFTTSQIRKVMLDVSDRIRDGESFGKIKDDYGECIGEWSYN